MNNVILISILLTFSFISTSCSKDKSEKICDKFLELKKDDPKSSHFQSEKFVIESYGKVNNRGIVSSDFTPINNKNFLKRKLAANGISPYEGTFNSKKIHGMISIEFSRNNASMVNMIFTFPQEFHPLSNDEMNVIQALNTCTCFYLENNKAYYHFPKNKAGHNILVIRGEE